MIDNQIKIATIRGAGLAFPLACVGYLLSGNLYALTLVFLGAATGFAFGFILKRNPALKTWGSRILSRTHSPPYRQKKMMNLLAHPNPFVRFASLMAMGTLLFLFAWCIGYYVLTEGLFRAGANAHMIRTELVLQSESVFQEWIAIFRANLLPSLLIILGSLLIRVNGFSFGYLVALFNLVGYGLFVGTNSFAIAYTERMAPSFEILSRSGPYEMMALVLLATATYFWPLFEIKQIFITEPERVRQGPQFSWTDVVGIGFGLGILMAANWIEAMMVLASY